MYISFVPNNTSQIKSLLWKKNCFRLKSTKESIEYFKQYLQNYSVIQVVLKDFIRKYIINQFQRDIHALMIKISRKHPTKSKLLQTNQSLNNK